MKKLPDLKVGAYPWKTVNKVLPDNIMGYCDTERKEIQLNSNRNVSYFTLLQAYVHEAFHTVESVYLTESLDEDVIDQLAEGWTQLMLDNPKFVRLFLD